MNSGLRAARHRPDGEDATRADKTIQELMDPVAIEARLAVARARRAEVLAAKGKAPPTGSPPSGREDLPGEALQPLLGAGPMLSARGGLQPPSQPPESAEPSFPSAPEQAGEVDQASPLALERVALERASRLPRKTEDLAAPVAAASSAVPGRERGRDLRWPIAFAVAAGVLIGVGGAAMLGGWQIVIVPPGADLASGEAERPAAALSSSATTGGDRRSEQAAAWTADGSYEFRPLAALSAAAPEVAEVEFALPATADLPHVPPPDLPTATGPVSQELALLAAPDTLPALKLPAFGANAPAQAPTPLPPLQVEDAVARLAELTTLPAPALAGPDAAPPSAAEADPSGAEAGIAMLPAPPDSGAQAARTDSLPEVGATDTLPGIPHLPRLALPASPAPESTPPPAAAREMDLHAMLAFIPPREGAARSTDRSAAPQAGTGDAATLPTANLPRLRVPPLSVPGLEIPAAVASDRRPLVGSLGVADAFGIDLAPRDGALGRPQDGEGEAPALLPDLALLQDPALTAAPTVSMPPAPPPATPQAAETPGEVDVRIALHYPPDAAEHAAGASDALAEGGVDEVETRPVSITISSPNVRFFHEVDREAAEEVASLLSDSLGGVEVAARSFTDFRPRPDAGLLEVWLAGEAPRPAANTSRATAARSQPQRSSPRSGARDQLQQMVEQRLRQQLNGN